MKIGKAGKGDKEKASFLICGDSGSGKTTLAAKFPKPFIIMLEPNGRNSIAYVNKDIDVAECDTLEDIREAVRHFSKNKDKYETLVLDSGTELDRVVCDEVIAATGRPAMELQHYKPVAKKSYDILHALRCLDCNLVVLYLLKEKQDNHQEFVFRPEASGNDWAMKIPSLFNYVFRTVKATKVDEATGKVDFQFMLETKSTDKIILKDHPKLPQYIPSDPAKWLGIVMPERYPELKPTKKQEK